MLIVLGLFVAASHVVHSALIRDTRSAARVIELSGRMRWRSQRTADLSEQYVRTHDSDTKARIRIGLADSAAHLESNLALLLSCSAVADVRRNDDNGAFAQRVSDLQRTTEEQVFLAQSLIKAVEAEPAALQLSQEHGALLSSNLGGILDEVCYQLTAQSEADLATLSMVATLNILLSVVVVALCASWFWSRVIRPIHKDRVQLRHRAQQLEGRVAESREELVDQKRLLDQVVQRVPQGVVVVGSDGSLLLHNEEAARIFGKPAPGASAVSWISRERIFLPDGVTPHPDADLPVQRVLRGDSVDASELFLRDPVAGQQIWLTASARALVGEGGDRRGGVLVFRDTTRERRVRTALRESEARLRRAVLESPFPVLIHAEDGRILARSRVVERLTGHSADATQTLDQWVFHVIPAARRKEERESFRRLFKTSEKVLEHEVELTARDGRQLTWSFSSAALGSGADGRRLVISMAVDVTQEKRSRDALRAAKDAAETHSRAKSEFLANMSHELRTPLNAILGFGQLLRDKVPGELNESQARYVDNVLSSGRHLLALINDILDLAKVESGRSDLFCEKLDAIEVLESVLRLVSDAARRKNIELSVDQADAVPSVEADEGKLKQILINLLSNAIKFTPNDGRVTVRVRADGDGEAGRIWFEVEDNGIGISADNLERVFDKFTRVDSPAVRAQEGTGLGLALTRLLVRLHGGSIEARSSGRHGQGSVFAVELPLRRDAVGAPSLDDTSESPHVLVICSDRVARERYGKTLRSGGFAVSCLRNSDRGIAEGAVAPEVVLFDACGGEVSELGKFGEVIRIAVERGIPIVLVGCPDCTRKGWPPAAIELGESVSDLELLAAVARALAPGPLAPVSAANSEGG